MLITIYYLKKDHYYNNLFRKEVASVEEAKKEFEKYCNENRIEARIARIVEEKVNK